MPIKVRCPSCQDAFQTSSKNRGRRIKCPACGASIRVSKRKKSKQAKTGDADLSDDAIAAVLADGDDFQREYVPNAFDDDEPSELDTGESVIDSGLGANGVAANDAGSGVLAHMGDSIDPESSSDSVITRKPTPLKTEGFNLNAMAPPFVAGVIVGAAVTAAVLLSQGGVSPAPAVPVAPPAPRVNIEPIAPPENAEEIAALLEKVTVVSTDFESGGGLLGGGRTLIVRIKNESGLVLTSATLDAKLNLAAFDDAVIAEQQVVAPFSPVLGIGEEQEVRIAAPGGSPLAGVELKGPVRLLAEIVDLDWQGKK